jgi:hypothetical protein
MNADLVGEGGVVGDAGRVGAGQQQAVAVLVLQPLAVQRGAAGGGAEQEAAAELVGAAPTSGRRCRWKPNIE